MEGLIEISELQPGMLVQFYKTWRCIESGLHCHPKMEKYFGQVVTVKNVTVSFTFCTRYSRTECLRGSGSRGIPPSLKRSSRSQKI